MNRRKGQFSPLRFYKSKIVNVFCPYFILSLLLLAAGWISHHWFGYDIPFINDGTPVASLWDVLRCLAYGSASLVPYWYIPFIMTVFSVGPLIFHLPTGLLQKILLPASVLPLMVPRLLVSPLRNLCFFVPIFLMGVYCARNRDACMAFIRRHLSAIRVTAVLTSLLIVADHYFGSFMPNIEGAYYVQKLCIGSWVLELLEGMDREVLALDFLARYSFPLFFLHAIFQGIFQAPLFQVLGAALPGQVFTIANLTVTVEIALCILCILGIKKVMGKRSRYLMTVLEDAAGNDGTGAAGKAVPVFFSAGNTLATHKKRGTWSPIDVSCHAGRLLWSCPRIPAAGSCRVSPFLKMRVRSRGKPPARTAPSGWCRARPRLPEVPADGSGAKDSLPFKNTPRPRAKNTKSTSYFN